MNIDLHKYGVHQWVHFIDDDGNQWKECLICNETSTKYVYVQRIGKFITCAEFSKIGGHNGV
jgi:hypothetical protein